MFAALAILAIGTLVYLDHKECRDRMSQITPLIYISNWNGATDEDLLREVGIRRVICVTRKQKSERDLRKYKRLGIEHFHFSLPDVPDAPIELIFPKAYMLIDESIRRGEPVLIHCQAGISRSVTIVAAYLIQKNKVSAPAALGKIRASRPIARPNSGFLGALARLEQRNR